MLTIRSMVVALILVLNTWSLATTYIIPDQPPQPSTDEVLAANSLDRASEKELLNFVRANWIFARSWLPEVSQGEVGQIENEYLRKADRATEDVSAYWKKATEELREQRLHDKRRIVDAVLRKIGKTGSAMSIGELAMHAVAEDCEWAKWKALASVLELMGRVEPDKATDAELAWARPEMLAPLLGDLPPPMAEKWALRLWKRSSHIHYDEDYLRTRLWLARFFATADLSLATNIFRQSIGHYDPTITALSIMLLRTGIGGSLDWGASQEQLIQMMEKGKWRGATSSIWESMPEPLACPVARKHWGGRVDLVWLDATAKQTKAEEDVWVDAARPFCSGLIWGRLTSSVGALATHDGNIQMRVSVLSSTPAAPAWHGGVCLLSGSVMAEEIETDGSLLWQVPVSHSIGDWRFITPSSKPGLMLLLGYNKLACIDRRGDFAWNLDLKGLDDPRWVMDVGDDRLLVCCTKSVGWLSTKGEYQPVLEGLGSALWVAYNPTKPWVVFDGSDWSVVIFDSQSGKVCGRFDTDDGGGKYPSRFKK